MSEEREGPRIHVNGELRHIRAGTTLADLVAELGLEPGGVAVELNREVVPRSQYGARPLHEGDRVEVVRAIGGG